MRNHLICLTSPAWGSGKQICQVFDPVVPRSGILHRRRRNTLERREGREVSTHPVAQGVEADRVGSSFKEKD